MTIGKGEPWGEQVARPDGLRIVDDDAELPAALSGPAPTPIGLAGGDLHATLGAPALGDRACLTRFPIDLLEASIDGRGPIVACAHVVAHRPWWAGGWLRGRLLIAMNAEYLDGRDLAPRGHPNDGKVEVLETAASMSIRQRIVAERRSRRGAHLPHPDLRLRSTSATRWEFERSMVLRVDGRRIGHGRTVELRVRPDAATVYA